MRSEVEHVISRAQKGRALFVAAFLLLAGGVIYAVAVNFQQEDQIVRSSPCATDPTGERCEALQRRIRRDLSISAICVTFRRVGYECPKGGGAQQPSTGNQQPGPAPAGPTEHHPIQEVVEGVGEVVQETVCSLPVLLCG